MTFRNVLVPVDFSPASRHVVEFAVTFARNFRAQLTLLHVEEPDKAGKQDTGPSLNHLLEMLPPGASDDLAVQTRIRIGNIEEEIRTAIDDERAGIVVMGTHHHGVIRRLLAGSVTEDLLRKMQVPLLTVASDSPTAPLRRILFATDLTEPSREGFRFALEIAQAFGANMFLHHAIEPIPVTYGGSMPVIDDPTDRKALMDQALGSLSELVVEASRQNVVAVSEVTEGAASGKILQAAEQSGCGLIVITVHSKGLLERALLGSTAERVVREARIPVLSFPVHHPTNTIEDKVLLRNTIPDPSAIQ